MNMLEAIAARHTVRKYLPNPIPADVRAQLDDYVTQLNEKLNLQLELHYNDESAFNAAHKLLFAKGAKNYLVLGSAQDDSADERLGRAGCDFMLFAQQLGLNSWWLGGTYSRGKIEQAAEAEHVIGIIVIGYGATQGKPHKSKSAADVSSYDGEAPEWFKSGVAAALLAPTAINRQAFKITGQGNEVHIEYAPGPLSDCDKGIVERHFEIGAGTENFTWI